MIASGGVNPAAARDSDGMSRTELSEQHRLLIEAIIGSDDAAMPALVEWADLVDINDVDRVTFAFLPHLYVRGTALGFQGSPMPQLRNVYKQAFYRNNVFLQFAREIVAQLAGADIRTVVLGDAVAATEWYPDAGARRIDVLQILVPAGRHSEASAVLEKQHGTTSIVRLPQWARWLQGAKSFQWQELRIDLLQQAALYAANPTLDEEILDAASITHEDDLSWHIPSSTHQLLLTLLDYRFHGNSPSLQWLIDALAILQKRPGDLSWERLVDMAIRYNLTVAVSGRVSTVRSFMPTSIPGQVIETLRKVKPSRHEEREFALRYHPARRFNSIGWHFHHYRLRYAEIMPLTKYLSTALGATSALSLPFTIVAKAAGRPTRSHPPTA